jgi:oligopeptidase B
MTKSLILLLMAATILLNANDKKTSSNHAPNVAANPPVAKKIHTENHINGETLVDDYKWLREKSNPEVTRYLEAENAYTDAVMKPTDALQQKLNEEMISHIKETDVNVPYKEGDYFYYSRWEKGRQYPIPLRTREFCTRR